MIPVRLTVVLLSASLVALGGTVELPNPGFESPGGGFADGWGSFSYGGGDIRKLEESRSARSGAKAIKLNIHGGEGGQGLYVDVPVSSLHAGDKIEFSIHARSENGRPLKSGLIDLHIEFMDAMGKILSRTDTLGTSGVIGKTLGPRFKRYVTTHRLKESDVNGGLGQVNRLRLVVVAIQPEEVSPRMKLGAVIVDDAELEMTSTKAE